MCAVVAGEALHVGMYEEGQWMMSGCSQLFYLILTHGIFTEPRACDSARFAGQSGKH